MSTHLIPNNDLHAKARTRAWIAIGVAFVLLIISGCDFWVLLNLSQKLQFFPPVTFGALLLCMFVPLILAFALIVDIGQKKGQERLASSYQSRLDQMQLRLHAQEDFVRVITDNNPEAIAIFDNQNNFWFVNAGAAKELNRSVKDIVGQPLHKVLSNERARIIDTRLKAITESGKPLEALEQKINADGQVRFVQTRFEIIPQFVGFSGGVIGRSEDVTNLLVERERRENMLRQVVNTLVAVVDRRDPFAAGHSSRVGQLSRALAEEMVLSEREIETAEIAGTLMNFGKVLVPREILTKNASLTPEELQRVRESILTSADILSIIDFPTPIVPTLRQVLERYDGSGVPHGLREDSILVTARIVAVANAFIALVSARAHREGLDTSVAVDKMQSDADTIFDRQVVTSLANYVQTHAAKIDWLKPKTKK